MTPMIREVPTPRNAPATQFEYPNVAQHNQAPAPHPAVNPEGEGIIAFTRCLCPSESGNSWRADSSLRGRVASGMREDPAFRNPAAEMGLRN